MYKLKLEPDSASLQGVDCFTVYTSFVYSKVNYQDCQEVGHVHTQSRDFFTVWPGDGSI